MGKQPNAVQDAAGELASNGDRPSLDPLRRVWVPVERRNLDGTWTFKTTDGRRYRRGADGAIRRIKE